MRLHLLRHGQSTWNVERRLQGQTMWVPLTDQGLAEAEAAAARLRVPGLRAIWSSDQVRAIQTATVIADAHGVPVSEVAELREVALGELEGRHYDDLAAQETPPGVHTAEVRWGNGESLVDVEARLRPMLARLDSEFGPDDDVVLVSHGDTLRVLVTLLDGGTARDVDWDVWAQWPNGETISRDWP